MEEGFGKELVVTLSCMGRILRTTISFPPCIKSYLVLGINLTDIQNKELNTDTLFLNSIGRYGQYINIIKVCIVRLLVFL